MRTPLVFAVFCLLFPCMCLLGCYDWHSFTFDSGTLEDADTDNDSDIDVGIDSDIEVDADIDVETGSDTDGEICESQDQLACNDDGDVIWLDSCGQQEEGIVEYCPSKRGRCSDGVCGCQEGWSGDNCGRCLVYVNRATGNDENSGSSWDQALSTVVVGLENASASGCDVWVAVGTYYPTEITDRDAAFQLVSGVGLYGGFSGTEAFFDERNIVANRTILSGDIDENGTLDDGNVYHVVIGADNAVIDGFIITGGYAHYPNSFDARNNGGGMHNVDTSPTVTNCTFSDNSARYNGGGIVNSLSSSSTITNCTFLNNSARNGGGIQNGAFSSSTITNCIFLDNSANYGGGMDNGESTPTITNCTFSNNSATYAGGGMNSRIGSPSVTNSIFWGNTADKSEPQIRSSESDLTVTYSDIQGGFEGTGNISSDPLLDGSLRLREGSPCIDAGDNSVFIEGATDRDGNSRIVDGDRNGSEIVDMGAFEFDPTP